MLRRLIPIPWFRIPDPVVPDPDPVVPDPDPVVPGPDTPYDGPITDQSAIWQAADVTGLTEVAGKSWWDRYASDVSFVMGTDLDASKFSNELDLSAYGNALNNNMLGNNGDNRLEGGLGDDRIFGREGNDTVLGGAGNDTLEGTGGNDALYGGLGDDSLKGGEGDDILLTTSGNDTIDGDNGIDTVLFTGSLNNYTIDTVSGAFVISNITDAVTVRDTEVFVFAGQEVAATDLLDTHAAVVAAFAALADATPTPDPVLDDLGAPITEDAGWDI